MMTFDLCVFQLNTYSSPSLELPLLKFLYVVFVMANF